MNLRRVVLGAAPILLFACGDDSPAKTDAAVGIDAKEFKDAGIDAFVEKPAFSWDEGGEVRLEYLYFPAGGAVTDRARATEFFFKGPKFHGTFPMIPGCTRYDAAPPTVWPLAQDPNRQYLDVGQAIITGGPTQLNIPAGTVPGSDFLDRQFPTGAKWHYTGTTLNNMGRMYITDDTKYDVVLTGSSEWPAQIFDDAHGGAPLYMPDQFTLIDPPATDGQPSLTAGQPMTITFTPGASANLPAGLHVDTLVAFTNGNPPVLVCVEEGNPRPDGSITIPAADIDFVRAAVCPTPPCTGTTGRILRQNVVHQLRELTDGVTHEKRRIDFISVWCWNYPFQVP